jgi:hypothetical protein
MLYSLAFMTLEEAQQLICQADRINLTVRTFAISH